MASSPETSPTREVRFEYARNLPKILDRFGISLIVSTYQAGKIVTISARQDDLSVTFHNFDRPMGVAFKPDCLAVASRQEVWFLRSAASIAASIKPAGTYDACFLARQAHFTGEIQAHELWWGGNDLWVVNTLFSCLCTVGGNYSFVPRWHPPFISELAPDDRCHLNGVAFENDKPRYVTAMSQTDVRQGWREDKVNTGCLIDVSSGRALASGFAMPHSPRLHAGRLWLLDSGRGRLVDVKRDSGSSETVAELPGYTRGLAFYGQLGFVGLSKIRETSTFWGVPIAESKDELKCGVGVVELTTGQLASTFEFCTGVEEIFDIAVMPQVRAPFLQGPRPVEDHQEAIWLAPEEARPADSPARET
jgi:uncharacterized protein (TIGR03032 family)